MRHNKSSIVYTCNNRSLRFRNLPSKISPLVLPTAPNPCPLVLQEATLEDYIQ